MADCSIYFGISGLKHPDLVNNFYPEDLPADWYIDYYSNEFDLLLSSAADFSQSKESAEGAYLMNIIDELQDSIEDKTFLCLLDIKVPLKQTSLSESGKLSENIVLLGTEQISDEYESVNDFQWRWSKESVVPHSGILCLVRFTKKVVAPKAIKQLIETIREYAGTHGFRTVYVVFEGESVLEICRHAMVIESMM